MQVDPIKPTLKAPGAKRLTLKHDNRFQICFKFAFNFNLRCYTVGVASAVVDATAFRRLRSKRFHTSGRVVQVDPIKTRDGGTPGFSALN